MLARKRIEYRIIWAAGFTKEFLNNSSAREIWQCHDLEFWPTTPLATLASGESSLELTSSGGSWDCVEEVGVP